MFQGFKKATPYGGARKLRLTFPPVCRVWYEKLLFCISLKYIYNFTAKFTPFNEFINKRREEAKRSILIQVKSQECSEELMKYCQRNFGNLKHMYFHHNENNPAFANFYLLEFENEETIKEIGTYS